MKVKLIFQNGILYFSHNYWNFLKVCLFYYTDFFFLCSRWMDLFPILCRFVPYTCILFNLCIYLISRLILLLLSFKKPQLEQLRLHLFNYHMAQLILGLFMCPVDKCCWKTSPFFMDNIVCGLPLWLSRTNHWWPRIFLYLTINMFILGPCNDAVLV